MTIQAWTRGQQVLHCTACRYAQLQTDVMGPATHKEKTEEEEHA